MEMASRGSAKKDIILSRKELFLMVRTELKFGVSSIIEHLEKALTDKHGSPVKIRDEMKRPLSCLFSKMRSLWKTARRGQERFFKKNKLWLDNTVSFPVGPPPENNSNIGRPPKDFASSSERSKRRKTGEIRTSLTSTELAYALQMNLRSEGKLDASKLVKDLASSPSRASKYRSALKSSKGTTTLSDDALALMVKAKMTKSQYQAVRSGAGDHNCGLYPSYKNVAQARQRCYPPKTTITFTETSAEVELQALLGHTLNRVLLLNYEQTRNLKFSNMEFICKWGSSGQSSTDSEAQVFLTSVVPLQLVCVNYETNEKKVLWKNPRTSSPRFCRVLIMQTIQGNESTTAVDAVERVEKQIQSLVPFRRALDGKEISITCKMELIAKVDDEVCNAVLSTESSQRCHLCGTASEDFSQIDAILEKDIRASDISFGLSISHLWIRFFECCLHLSCQIGIKKWRASNEEEKQITEIRGRYIRKGLRMRLGLDLDRSEFEDGGISKVRMARSFFKNSSTSSSVTGLNEDLINRFAVILQALSSGHDINCEMFNDYGLETARQFFYLYPWYHMPMSVHKVLIHGPEIIASALLPTGKLSQEIRREYIERFHRNFMPPGFRGKTIKHIFKQRMANSDPYITIIGKLPCRKLRRLTLETVKLLLDPTTAATTGTTARCAIDTDSDDTDSDYNVDSEYSECSESDVDSE